MSTKIVLNGSVVEAVYDDRFREIFQALGTPHIRRATDVEYDEQTRDWIATHRDSGTVIARGPERAKVIEAEVKWLEEQLVTHRQSRCANEEQGSD